MCQAKDNNHFGARNFTILVLAELVSSHDESLQLVSQPANYFDFYFINLVLEHSIAVIILL